jgi:hypothetical protein
VATARLFAAYAGLALLASTAACAPPARPAQPPSGYPAALVDVTNSSWFDVVVYSVGSGARFRLGMVTSMSSGTFRIPRRDVVAGSGLRLLADPIGSRQIFVSERILVGPGQRVELTVMPQLPQSYYAVRE